MAASLHLRLVGSPCLYRSDGRSLARRHKGVRAVRDRLRIAPACVVHAAAQGGHGLWAMLQSRRLAALRGLKEAARAAEARAVALALWPRLEAGVGGMETFARMASELCATLAPTDPDLAETIALRAGGWMLRAAATLPMPWRENYLARAPLLDTMPPRERGVLTALGLAGSVLAGGSGGARPLISPAARGGRRVPDLRDGAAGESGRDAATRKASAVTAPARETGMPQRSPEVHAR